MEILSKIRNRALFCNFIENFDDSYFPKFRDINKYCGLYKVDVYNVKPSVGNMHEDVYSGISECEFEAYSIAYSEFFERKAVSLSGIGYSNGCAAQPVYSCRRASLKIAAERGYNESLERHGFYSWFNNKTILHCRIEGSKHLNSIGNILKEKRSLGQSRIMTNKPGYLIISYIELDSGVIFGTAFDTSLKKSQLRSESELLRNCLSFVSSNKAGSNISKNDQDIFLVATRGQKFIERLRTSGYSPIIFPTNRKTHELYHHDKENIVVVRSVIDDTRFCKQTLLDYS